MGQVGFGSVRIWVCSDLGLFGSGSYIDGTSLGLDLFRYGLNAFWLRLRVGTVSIHKSTCLTKVGDKWVFTITFSIKSSVIFQGPGDREVQLKPKAKMWRNNSSRTLIDDVWINLFDLGRHCHYVYSATKIRTLKIMYFSTKWSPFW